MRLSRNVVVLGIVSLVADISSDMVMPLLPAFVVALGGGAAFIGVIEGAAEGISALLKYASGRWADRVRRLLPLAVAGYVLAAVARPLLAVARAPWQVLAVRSVDRVGKGIRTTPRDKLLAASAPREQLAEAFAFHRGMDHAGAAIGPLIAAGLLLIWPGEVRRVFLLASIPGAIAVLALLAVREQPREPAAPGPRGASGGAVPVRLLTAIGLFTLGNSTDALLLLRAGTLGIPLARLPLLWALLHLVRAVFSWPLGRAADLLGRTRTLIAGWLWYAACYAGFALARAPWQMWALFAGYGLVAALTEGTERALIADAAPPAARGRALGLYNLVTGLGLLAASVLAGEVWEQVSPAAALTMGAVLAFAASATLAAGPRAGGQAPAV
ncbi:MAG TPA: MFS transporter [Myxococcales bacterium]|nr:MFS transporter [Myxococcales bacterium]